MAWVNSAKVARSSTNSTNRDAKKTDRLNRNGIENRNRKEQQKQAAKKELASTPAHGLPLCSATSATVARL